METATQSKIDNLPPVSVAEPKGQSYNKAQTVYLRCSDNKSGCDTSGTRYSLDQNQSTNEFLYYDYENEKGIYVDNSTTLRFYSVDYNGVVENPKSEKYIIDYAPTVGDGTLNFTISNGVINISWINASDTITPLSGLLYQLYYAEQQDVFSSVQDTFNAATPYWSDWLNATSAEIDTNDPSYASAKNYFWQVLVKDENGNENITAYTVAQYPTGTAIIPKVTIDSKLTPDLLVANRLSTGQLTAYIGVDNATRQAVQINTIDANNANVSIEKLGFSANVHRFTLTYEFILNSSNNVPVVVAQASLEQDFSTGQTQFTIPVTDFTFNEDNDHVSNIKEILAGTNPLNFQWVWVSGSNVVNSKSVYDNSGGADPVPGARYGATSWVDSNNLKWLFGGWGYDTNASGWLNDLWRWDGSAWTWISGSNTVNSSGVYDTLGGLVPVPGARDGATAWIDSNNQLWLLGGRGYDANALRGRLNDLWRWDGTSWTWVSGSKKVNSSGVYDSVGGAVPVPGARSSATSSWTDSDNHLWLFGGSGNLGYMNDLWRLEP